MDPLILSLGMIFIFQIEASIDRLKPAYLKTVGDSDETIFENVPIELDSCDVMAPDDVGPVIRGGTRA